MFTQKLAEVVTEIDNSTKRGLLDWERTEYKRSFQVSFPNYSVRITETDSDVPEAVDYTIQIFDNEGQLIDQGRIPVRGVNYRG